MFEGGADNITVMNVRANGTGCVEPERVNQIEIAGVQCRCVRAELIGGGRAARMVNDEPNAERLGTRRALPRLAKQPRLFLCGQRLRFADVNLRGLEPQRGLGHRLGDVHARGNQQTNRPAVTLGQRHDGRQQQLLVIGRTRMELRIVRDVEADQANGHHHDVAVARRMKGGGEMCQNVRLADGHQQVAWACFHALEIDFLGGEQLEFVERRRRVGLCRMAHADQQRRRERQHEHGPGQRARIGHRQHRDRWHDHQYSDEPQPDRPHAAGNGDIERHQERARLAAK